MENALRVVLLLIFIVPVSSEVQPTPKPRKALTAAELRQTDVDVRNRLEQLHKTIDAVQETMKNMNDGYDYHAKQNADRMKLRFEKLSAVVSRLTKQNSKLNVENRQLRQEKTTLVDKISKLEVQLDKLAAQASNSGVGVWMKQTATDLRKFLEENGLEHFKSPRFSPIIAGLVSNGVVLLPLAMATFFLLHYSKNLTVLRIVMALNLFDLGFALAIIASSALLLGDPFEGMRHISEINFVFIQMVVGGVFWLTAGFLVAAIIQNRTNRAWKFSTVELMLRSAVALDYSTRVWNPVMERDDVPIAMQPVFYLTYLASAVTNVYLTSKAGWHVVYAQKTQIRKQEEEMMVSFETHRGN
ncbi:hypothetical protein BWQ96_09525 [Gracilariopsis chorda]|uniref:Uncharacterized protein n=1 Tax=Gracilariopsis chorda TaxID=448386 RepID=A0A2V3IFF0_9FLOR|nr:hypothetical protein BWQ96_09525 [Gracilariopsis chorda]|eukprot:PXF40763.1 hypothetical protein BWQ96_09525 [Gracilariopsis chorda]